MQALEGSPLIDAPHHKPLCDVLDRVIAGEIDRLIIDIPPGYGKTLNSVWALVSRGFAVNPGARFIHASYSSDLALDNSTRVKDILGSEEWQCLAPVVLKSDQTAKGLWRTEEGGGLRAAQAGGQITGFRAGRLDQEGFTGALIIDDPLKPDDARSRKKTADQNRRYNTTMASRLAHERVPIIVIMQRLCAFTVQPEDDIAESGDLVEYLLRGGSGERWHHLELPVEIDNSIQYPGEWTHGIPVDHGLPDGPLWEAKHTAADIARLKRADIYTYSAQYAQRPKQRTGDSLIKGEWFGRYSDVPPLVRTELFADTANKAKESSDYSVFMAAGVDAENNLYILEVLRGKWNTPDLYPIAMDFWNKWVAQGASRINIEDKASGTFLIQSMEQAIHFSVNPIPRNIDKFTRVNGVVERISSRRVNIPSGAPWVSDFIVECEDFTDDDSHAYDDQVDTLCDAIETLVHTIPAVTEQSFNVGFM